jgi:hypothetical protein
MIIARAFCVSFVMCSDPHFEMELAARLSFSAARFSASRSAGLHTSRISRHMSAAASRMIESLNARRPCPIVFLVEELRFRLANF